MYNVLFQPSAVTVRPHLTTQIYKKKQGTSLTTPADRLKLLEQEKQ